MECERGNRVEQGRKRFEFPALFYSYGPCYTLRWADPQAL